MSWTENDIKNIKTKGLKVKDIKSIEILKKAPKRKKQPEYELQVAICNYLSVNYPDLNFISDTIASVKLTLPQQVRNKKIQCSNFKCPDILILKPNGKYCGLFIELKVVTPFKKDGNLKKCEHLEGQQKSIDDLNAVGYYATFSWGFEMTKSIIDEYLSNC